MYTVDPDYGGGMDRMTEKRFTFDGKDCFDNGEFWLDLGLPTYSNIREICNMLNELTEENQFLNKQLNIYRDASKVDARENKELLEDIDELYEENQQLRQLLNIGKTNAKDIVDVLNMQQRENKELQQFKDKVFSLIDDKIIFVNACEETSRIPKEDYYRGALEILELLKKELKYDRE